MLCIWLESVSQNKICDQSDGLVNALNRVNQANTGNVSCCHGI